MIIFTVVSVALALLLLWWISRLLNNAGIGRESTSQGTSEDRATRRALEIRIFGAPVADFETEELPALAGAYSYVLSHMSWKEDVPWPTEFLVARVPAVEELRAVVSHLDRCRDCEDILTNTVDALGLELEV